MSQKNGATTKISGALSSGDYTFSGGNGTDEANAFKISKPDDLIELSNAVNTGATYTIGSTTYKYADAYYRMTNNIDMGQKVDGPFIRCSELVTGERSLTGLIWSALSNPNVHQAEIVLPAIMNPNNSYTANRALDDDYNHSNNSHANPKDKITLASKSESIKCETKRESESFGSVLRGRFTYHFTYSFFDINKLPKSALMQPIGRFVSFEYEGKQQVIAGMSKPFQGTFDGGGFTISNFELVTAADAAGLFGFLSNEDNHDKQAVVKNLNMQDCNISNCENKNAGIIAGVVGYGSIQNCSVTQSSVCGTNAGGLAGSIVDGFKLIISNTGNGRPDGSVQNSSSSNNEISGTNVGGIVGNGTTSNTMDSIINNTTSHNGVNGDNSGTILGETMVMNMSLAKVENMAMAIETFLLKMVLHS